MPFLGTIINFFTVLIFGTLGALIKKGIPKRISDAIMSGMAVCVIYIGIDGVLETAPAVPEGSPLSSGIVKILIMILSMGLGTLIGELINFEKMIVKVGDMLERIVDKNSIENGTKGNFSRGFVSCSILFCVGAMTINGAIFDGMGEPDILLAKAVIDAFACFVMATTFGIGCAFSAIFVLIYQGSIALLSFFLYGAIPVETISYMSMTGSLIIILVGLNALGVTKIKTANMIPAMFMPLILKPLFWLILEWLANK